MDKHISLLITIFLMLIIVSSFYSCNKQQKDESETIRKIKIVDLMEANNLHFAVAKKNGYLSDEGLNVALSYESVGLLAMNKLESDEADYAVIVEMNLAKRVFEKDDITILTELAEPKRAIKIVGRKDMGVRNASDLVGKKIALLKGVNIHKYMLMYLEENGITSDQVEIINMKPPEAYHAFNNGSVHATILWEPHIYKLKKSLGDKMTVLTDEGHKYWTFEVVLATKKTTLSKNRNEAKKILRALLKADEFIKNNKDSAQIILAQQLDMEKDEVNEFWDEIEFDVKLTDSLTTKLEKEVAWFKELGLKKGEPIDTSFTDNISNILFEVLKEN